MSITGTDLTTPTGELTVDLLTALVPTVATATTAADVATAYATVGTTYTVAWTANADAGAIAWGTAQAMRARAQQILTSAMSAGAEGASESFSTAQAVELQKRATQLEAIVSALPTASTPSVAPLTTRQTPLTFAW